MTSKLLSKIVVLSLMAISILTSCTKKETTTPEKKNFFYKMNTNGAEMLSDVVAIHCETDSSNIYRLSNKLENFNTGTLNYEEGDFRLFMNIIAGDEHRATGNHGLGIEFTDEDGLTIVRSTSELTITYVDHEIIEGTATGYHYKENPFGSDMIEFPFTLDFSAEILETADFCN